MLRHTYAALLCFSLLGIIIAEKNEHNLTLDFTGVSSNHIFLEDTGSTVYSGVPPFPFLIVLGQRAVRGQFCYQAYLKLSNGRNDWTCGGSLVTTSVILTAAHCVKEATLAVVVLGALNLDKNNEPGREIVWVDSKGLKVHEKYNPNNKYNDIAVIRLPKPVKLNEYICTVKVPGCTYNLPEDFVNKNLFTIAGWGKTTDRTRTSHLMYYSASREPHDSCTIFYKTRARYNIIESQMCVSGATGSSTCNGDSGGPLVQPDKAGNVVQQGVVSLGLNSCETKAPSVFTDLHFFKDWLCPLLQL